MIRKIAKCAVALFVFAAPATALQANTTSVTTKVTRTLAVANDDWGGCAAQVEASLVDEGLTNCNDRWVTFSCSGDHASKSNAVRMFDQAQMAFALDRQVRIYVDDTKSHNGFCFANRIDVLAT